MSKVNSYRSSRDFIEANKAASASKERLLLIELAVNRINGDNAEHTKSQMEIKANALSSIEDILINQSLNNLVGQ